MAKINAFNVKSLTHDDAYGFMNEVGRQLKESCKTLPDAATVFLEALSRYNDALKGEETDFTSTELYEADENADSAWSGLNQYLKAMLNCPNDDMRTAAETIWSVFSKYENPTSKAFATEYGILERLLQDLDAIPAETKTLANAQIWIDELAARCQIFTTMYSLRVQAQANKMTGASKTAKLNASEAYREMVSVINALLIVSPTADLEACCTHINQLIETRQISLKARKTRTANANAKAEATEKA